VGRWAQPYRQRDDQLGPGRLLTASGWAQIAILVVILTALTRLLGGYLARVYQGQPVFLSRLVEPVERLLYRILRVDRAQEQDWKAYARSLLFFSIASWLALYAILRTQGIQPFNPRGFASGPWNLSFNTASSFVSNTSWQYYGGETTLSYFSQMAGITVASFTSAAVGMAVAVFIAGLMVGRTPEYLGKKIGAHEIKLAVLGTLFVPILVLAITAVATSTQAGRQSLSAHGPQGYSESLYAYLSQANNNGSAFAGYTGFIQPVGRFIPILAVLALAGALAGRRVTPAGLGTLRTDTPTFVIFVVGFVIVFALLNFLAALFLGPLDQSLSHNLYP
jgi:K+-transporting ATPase ATPase A chain